MKHRVSGVPYEVEIINEYAKVLEEKIQRGDMISELELENSYLRANVQRLEGEVKDLKERIKVLQMECEWLEAKTREVKLTDINGDRSCAV